MKIILIILILLLINIKGEKYELDLNSSIFSSSISEIRQISASLIHENVLLAAELLEGVSLFKI